MVNASHANVLLVLFSTNSLMPHCRPRCFLKRMTGALLFAMSLVYTYPAFVSAQTCTVNASAAVPDASFDAIWTQNGPATGNEPVGGPGWTGADSTYSILLPNGDSAFFFSDSYIGESPAVSGDGTVSTDSTGLRTRAVNCNPPLCNPPTSLYRAHNSVVIRNGLTGSLTTLAGSPDVTGYSTSYFAPALALVTGHFYWMGDSIVVQVDALGTKKVWTFLMEFDGSWVYHGSAIAQLSLPTLTIEAIKPLNNVPAANVTSWGSAMWLDGAYGASTLYIYGMQGNNPSGKLPFIARTNPGLGLDAVTDTNNWTVWNGSQWVNGLTSAAPIIGGTANALNSGDSISDEYSVKKIRSSAGTTYLLVAQDTKALYGAWKDIVLYSACSPQGPFSAKQIVYSTPETGATRVPGMTSNQSLLGQLLTYNPHAHPQFTNKGDLLISYNLNASNSGDLIYADSYRPRFIRVHISGLRRDP
jgi:hypothetical protein